MLAKGENPAGIARTSLLHVWKSAASDWWRTRKLIARLGSSSPDERESATRRLLELGPDALPALRSALKGPVVIACGAAVAMSRMQTDEGMETVLVRCYNEEWLAHSLQEAHLSGIVALRRLERSSVGRSLAKALCAAPRERQLQSCLYYLTLALSSLRLLPVFDGVAPFEWWQSALHFGHKRLTSQTGDPFAGLAYTLTDYIRIAAMRGLLAQYPREAYATLSIAFSDSDVSVMRTALAGFQKLRDPRALPVLQRIAFSHQHPLALECRRTIEQIAGSGDESLVLVRGSFADANVIRSESLVRPADSPPSEETRVLLRPMM